MLDAPYIPVRGIFNIKEMIMKKKTLEEIKEVAKEAGFEVLSTEYRRRIDLEVRCAEGHRTYKSLQSLNEKRKCVECIGERIKTIEEVSLEFSNRGFKLLSDSYSGNQHVLNFRCPKGHDDSMTRQNFIKSKIGCKTCTGQLKPTIEEVRNYVELEGMALISKEYKSNRHKLEVLCSRGHERSVTYTSILRGHKCVKCYHESKTGIDSYVTFHNNPEKKLESAVFYTFTFTLEEIKYRKVGIAKSWKSRKYGYSRLDIEDLEVQPMTRFEAFEKEQKFLEDNDNIRNRNRLPFAGWTECVILKGE